MMSRTASWNSGRQSKLTASFLCAPRFAVRKICAKTEDKCEGEGRRPWVRCGRRPGPTLVPEEEGTTPRQDQTWHNDSVASTGAPHRGRRANTHTPHRVDVRHYVVAGPKLHELSQVHRDTGRLDRIEGRPSGYRFVSVRALLRMGAVGRHAPLERLRWRAKKSNTAGRLLGTASRAASSARNPPPARGLLFLSLGGVQSGLLRGDRSFPDHAPLTTESTRVSIGASPGDGELPVTGSRRGMRGLGWRPAMSCPTCRGSTSPSSLQPRGTPAGPSKALWPVS